MTRWMEVRLSADGKVSRKVRPLSFVNEHPGAMQ